MTVNTSLIKALIGAVLLVAIVLLDQHRTASAERRGFEKATSERAARDGLAVLKRVDDNALVAAKNDSINKFLTKDQNEKLAPVVAAITNDRVRIGTAICAGRAATPAEAKSAGSGNGADPASRMVQEQLERDIRALEIRVEEALATGRTCQQFLIEHDMVP